MCVEGVIVCVEGVGGGGGGTLLRIPHMKVRARG